jgi:hypothetical protein
MCPTGSMRLYDLAGRVNCTRCPQNTVPSLDQSSCMTCSGGSLTTSVRAFRAPDGTAAIATLHCRADPAGGVGSAVAPCRHGTRE